MVNGAPWRTSGRNFPPYCRQRSTSCAQAAGGVGHINSPYTRTRVPAAGKEGCTQVIVKHGCQIQSCPANTPFNHLGGPALQGTLTASPAQPGFLGIQVNNCNPLPQLTWYLPGQLMGTGNFGTDLTPDCMSARMYHNVATATGSNRDIELILAGINNEAGLAATFPKNISIFINRNLGAAWELITTTGPTYDQMALLPVSPSWGLQGVAGSSGGLTAAPDGIAPVQGQWGFTSGTNQLQAGYGIRIFYF